MASAIREQRIAYFNGTAFELTSKESVARELELPRPKPQPQPRTVARPRPKVNITPAILITIVVTAFALALVVFGYGKAYEAISEVSSLRSRLTELQEERAQLEGQYNSMVDYRAIEQDAIDRLGMMKPGNGQTIYVNLSGADRGEVLTGSGHSLFTESSDLVREAFSGLAAYFR